jgi:hypothetical protein
VITGRHRPQCRPPRHLRLPHPWLSSRRRTFDERMTCLDGGHKPDASRAEPRLHPGSHRPPERPAT